MVQLMLIIKDFLFSPDIKFVCPWEDTDLTSYFLLNIRYLLRL